MYAGRESFREGFGEGFFQKALPAKKSVKNDRPGIRQKRAGKFRVVGCGIL